MSKKYELTDITQEYNGVTLHRIRALKDLKFKRDCRLNVNKGDFGGWIESEDNLSQEGDCWIRFDAMVLGHAVVSEDALVIGTAIVSGHAVIRGEAIIRDNAHVFGNAHVCDLSIVSGNSQVFGDCFIDGMSRIANNAHVFGNTHVSTALISGNSWIHGNSHISQFVHIFGNASVFGNVSITSNANICENATVFGRTIINECCNLNRDAFIKTEKDYLVVGPIGSRDDYTTFYKSRDDIMVDCGCFNGTLDSFRQQVLYTHASNERHKKTYIMAADLAKEMLR